LIYRLLKSEELIFGKTFESFGRFSKNPARKEATGNFQGY